MTDTEKRHVLTHLEDDFRDWFHTCQRDSKEIVAWFAKAISSQNPATKPVAPTVTGNIPASLGGNPIGPTVGETPNVGNAPAPLTPVIGSVTTGSTSSTDEASSGSNGAAGTK